MDAMPGRGRAAMPDENTNKCRSNFFEQMAGWFDELPYVLQ
jgi:hypothetical protein